jgi:hypothetical protein
VIWVGIDPGVQTGVAVWDSESQTLELYTCDMVDAQTKLLFLHHSQKIKVVVEDARLRKRWPKGAGRLQGVGAIKQQCYLWSLFLYKHNFEYMMRAPQNTKISKQAFQKLTGYADRCSSHARDAAMSVWKRS